MDADPELLSALHDLYRAMSSGSAEAVEALYSLDPLAVFVGTDDAEFWTDSARHNADVRPYFDASSGALRMEPGAGFARSSGALGWTFDRPTMVLPDGTSTELRITLVWRREASGWRVVHSHASIGT
jgi:hypothetical protein